MTSGPVSLNCLIIEDPAECAFVVEIDSNKRVDHLRSIIKERRPDVFKDALSIHMSLWRVDVDPGYLIEKSLAHKNNLRHLIENILEGHRLNPLQPINKAFPIGLNEENVHVLIERPTLIAAESSIGPLIKRSDSVTYSKGFYEDNDDDGDSTILFKGSGRRKRSSSLRSVSTKISQPLTLDDIETGNNNDEGTEYGSQQKRRKFSSINNDDDLEERKPLISSHGSELGRKLAKNIDEKGLEYYTKAGRNASTTSIQSFSKQNDFKRLERIFFDYQEKRGKAREWPDNGLTIGMLFLEVLTVV
jgi:hypothetical protein